MPRRSHEPDPTSRRQVEAMAGYGVPEGDIAGVLAIDPKTLRKHYRGELDHGHVKANAKVAENLYRKATGDGREAVIAAIFWLKTRAGWRERSEVTLNATLSAELPDMTPEEWERTSVRSEGLVSGAFTGGLLPALVMGNREI